MSEYTENLDNLDVDHDAIDAAAERLRQASEEAEQAAKATDEANEAKAELTQRVINGHPVTESAWTKAGAACDLAALRQTGADQRLQRARNRREVTSIDLLATVARGLREVVPGVQLVAGVGKAPTTAPEGASLPVLVLTQEHDAKPSTEGGAVSIDGGLQGTVTLTYFREPIHKEIETDRVNRLLTEARISGSAHHRASEGRDVFTVNVSKAVPAVPAVSHGAKAVGPLPDYPTGRSWLSAVVNAATLDRNGRPLYGTRRVGAGDTGNGVYIDHAGAKGTAEVTNVEVSEGVRTLRVEIKDRVFVANADPRDVAGALERKAGWVEGFATIHGRITTAHLAVTNAVGGIYGAVPHLEVTLTVEVVSKA